MDPSEQQKFNACSTTRTGAYTPNALNSKRNDSIA
jgi:hypothetical protein